MSKKDNPPVFVIEDGSPAMEYLRRVLAEEDTRKITLQIRRDGLAVKVNEWAWTHTLEVEA